MLEAGESRLRTVDWLAIVLVLLFAWMGVRSGFLTGLLSLIGFVAGALIAARVAPQLLPDGERSPFAPPLTLLGAVVGGIFLALLLERVGAGIKAALPLPLLGTADRCLGALLGAVIGAAVVWLAMLVTIQLPASPAVTRELRKSSFLRALGSILPPADEVLGVIARFDPLPVVGGPSPAFLSEPSGDAVGSGAGGSVVRVRAWSCGLALEGSGWVGASGLVVTNAHVVAGDGSPLVERGGVGPGLDGDVVVFDRRNDIAVIAVDGLDLAPLGTAEADVGTQGAVLGFPLDGRFRSSPVTIGRTVAVLGDDAYGEGPVSRQVQALRGVVRPGNSGGPVVDRDGRVVGTVYGRTEGSRPRGGFAVPSRLVENALQRAKSGASDPTGPCSP
ncbi:MAG: CvpA family protein [Actinomycetes bacterium]